MFTRPPAAQPDEWNHVVWCREGTDTSVFINGTRADNRTLSGRRRRQVALLLVASVKVLLGIRHTGYITDARVVNRAQCMTRLRRH